MVPREESRLSSRAEPVQDPAGRGAFFHGVEADRQLLSDALVGPVRSQQAQHLQLAVGQRLDIPDDTTAAAGPACGTA
jgi:hypothetical protein